MGLGAVLEPLVVVSFLAGGTLVNRARGSRGNRWRKVTQNDTEWDADGEGRKSTTDADGFWSPTRSSSDSTIVCESPAERDPYRRQRTLRFWKWQKEVSTPNTEVHKDRLLSRLLLRLPFLVEVWYWALIYWVYQLGRAFTAVTLQESTVDTAREHALQVIHLEQKLGIFIEPAVQSWFLQDSTLMRWTNRTYSFIHIPGTILFLIVLYYVTTTRPRERLRDELGQGVFMKQWRGLVSHFGPDIYERRRRTMAMCNLLAFVVFTFWPCMPPRLLSDPNYTGEHAKEAKSYGFVDTVHGADGDSSVWTTNKFCNQYAAMPSLHFGYSFLVGLTIASMPLRRQGRMGWKRLAAIGVGMIYPGIILTAIVATANHFVLDAVAGAFACLIAWNYNHLLLNLLPLEDYFLNALRIHKPYT